jgi:hypothetical protein
VTQSLTGHRSHSELISELYDRHASGLFVYGYDQLGDPGSASDTVVAVLTGLPPVEPPRAALYALARREINRRDVTYLPPTVEVATDPATALIERVLREIRPHQREVLLLSAVCRLVTEEIAGVLEVARDTAGELILSARHRFTQSLGSALTHARSADYVPRRVAEVYGALEVAPVEDALARLPWRQPPLALRARLLAILPPDGPAAAVTSAGGLPTEQRWPTSPGWPVPLADPDEITQSGVFTAMVPPPRPFRPADPVLPPDLGQPVEAGRKPRHEATTEPMPRLHGALRKPPSAAETGPAEATGDVSAPPAPARPAPTPADVLDVPVEKAAPPPAVDPLRSPGPASAAPVLAWPPSAVPAVPGSLVPASESPESSQESESLEAAGADDAQGAEAIGSGTRRRRFLPRSTRSRRHEKLKPIKMGEHHYDWLWELAGLLIAIAIALIVFFSVPMIITP